MDKIICIGKNYLDHAKELGDAVPEMPVLFLKPESCLRSAHKNGVTLELPYPHGRGSLHHECEIVVRLSKGGSHLSPKDAKKSFDSVSLGLDMTLRDLQSNLKKNGHPWETSKVFTGAAAVGPFISCEDFKDFEASEFSLALEGEIKQRGTAKNMRLSIAECISYASQYFELCPGDLVFTGTPAGVGPVQAGSIATLQYGNKIKYSVKWI
jgi:2-keto-4-pentenoate hydratase/2-oxohepta-3-ene-1,7-dioic acid hydratase in catechol pathway